MATQTVHNASTGEITEIAVNDQYYRDNRPNQVIITIADTVKIVGQSETVSLQLVTHPLADGSTRDNVSASETVTMQFGDLIQDVELNNSGQWSDTLNCNFAGSFVIKALSHESNSITMVVS